MVAGPGDQQHLQVRIDQRRAGLIIAALGHAILDEPWVSLLPELEELHAWFMLRYIRLYKETPPSATALRFDKVDA